MRMNRNDRGSFPAKNDANQIESSLTKAIRHRIASLRMPCYLEKSRKTNVGTCTYKIIWITVCSSSTSICPTHFRRQVGCYVVKYRLVWRAGTRDLDGQAARAIYRAIAVTGALRKSSHIVIIRRVEMQYLHSYHLGSGLR